MVRLLDFKLLNMVFGSRRAFDYKAYWERRYRSGGRSGSGSCGELARYKADVVNAFVAERGVRSVIEFGCGDGDQLARMRVPRYLGLDVSEAAVARCAERFRGDPDKRFALYRPGGPGGPDAPGAPGSPATGERADLVLALDVLYHVVDDDDYRRTLADVFACAERWVLLYTNVAPRRARLSLHVRYRDTLAELARHPEFAVEALLDHPHADRTSARFIVLERQNAA